MPEPRAALQQIYSMAPLPCSNLAAAACPYWRVSPSAVIPFLSRELMLPVTVSGACIFRVVKTLCDELHPQAEKIVLVMDQIHTHGVASLDAAFPPAEAWRLAERLEIHHTPKHGSWLNTAELELSLLARQCLDERMESQEHLACEVAAWEQARNTAATRIYWRFTTADARVKLRHLYPQTLPC